MIFYLMAMEIILLLANILYWGYVDSGQIMSVVDDILSGFRPETKTFSIYGQNFSEVWIDVCLTLGDWIIYLIVSEINA